MDFAPTKVIAAPTTGIAALARCIATRRHVVLMMKDRPTKGQPTKEVRKEHVVVSFSRSCSSPPTINLDKLTVYFFAQAEVSATAFAMVAFAAANSDSVARASCIVQD